jgi:hypothetical protein
MLGDRVRTTGPCDTFVIRDLVSLVAWRRQLRTSVRPKRLPVVEFRFPGLAEEQNRCFTLLADEHRRACGCATGRAFLVIALVALIGNFLRQYAVGDVTFARVIALLAITVAAALIGKLAGLAWARLRLLMLVATVRRTTCQAAVIQPTITGSTIAGSTITGSTITGVGALDLRGQRHVEVGRSDEQLVLALCSQEDVGQHRHGALAIGDALGEAQPAKEQPFINDSANDSINDPANDSINGFINDSINDRPMTRSTDSSMTRSTTGQ